MDIFSKSWATGSEDFSKSLDNLFSSDTNESVPKLTLLSGDVCELTALSGTVSSLDCIFSVAASTLLPTEGPENSSPTVQGESAPKGLSQVMSGDNYSYLTSHVPPCMEAPSTDFLDPWPSVFVPLTNQSLHEPANIDSGFISAPVVDPLSSPIEIIHTESTVPTEPTSHPSLETNSNNVPSTINQWIHYDFQPDEQKQLVQIQELVPAVGTTKARGRRGPLDDLARKKAGDMRKTRACWNCRWSRKSCTGGTPCEQCKRNAQNRLMFNPCTRTKLETLSGLLIQEVLFKGYHPEKVNEFLNHRIAEWTDSLFKVDLTWGYGPPFACTVQRIVPRTADVMYSSEWWYVQEERDFCITQVLSPPIAFFRFDQSRMQSSFDEYLNVMVDSQFSGFPLFSFGPATFRGGILQLIYKLYEDQSRPVAVRTALKLLLLVYIMNHVIRVDHHSDIIRKSHLLFPDYPEHLNSPIGNGYHTPRLANIQIKMALSTMVSPMMGGVLRGLQYYICRRKRTEWTITVSVLIILALVIEELQVQIHLSVQAGEKPLLGAYTEQQAQQICNTMTHGGMEALLDLYTAAFGTWISEFGNGQLQERIEDIDPVDLSSLKFIGGLRFLSGKSDVEAARMYRIDEPGIRETVFPLKAKGVSNFFDEVAGRLFLKLFKD